MKKYKTEREGQIDFFENYHIPWQDNKEILIDNTDGIWKGNLFKFKRNINNVNSLAFQTIKYLSKLRIQGKSVPANFLLISLNTTTAYLFHSEDYRGHIQKAYIGAASKNDASFVVDNPYLILDYSLSSDAITLQGILNEEKFMPVDLDEDCILGWAERYYRENPKAGKGDFLGDASGQVPIVGEIREPRHFKGLIHPYKEKTNAKFQYLMDCLNNRLSKKDLGAFYTPEPYCRKAAELVRMAIGRVPVGNDYIILDRCAGTGNLEAVLTDEELSHCILSTYEYYEQKVLQERFGDKVRFIVSPTETYEENANGLILNADALSQEYISNPEIKKYVDDPKCTIILYENPPYRDDTSGMTGIKASNFTKKKNYVLQEMKKAGKRKTNEMANRFIWSAFQYYLRQPTDSYIVFSPIKYWKADKLINKQLLKSFVFNKKHFHASPSAIVCALWSNTESSIEEYSTSIYDINHGSLEYIKDAVLKQTHQGITKLFIKSNCIDDIKTKYCSSTNGELSIQETEKGIFNDNIIGFIVGAGFGLSNPNLNFNLTRLHTLTKNVVVPLRKDNYIKQLPFLAIKHYLMFERPWYETELTYCCSDGGNQYEKDKEFLKNCFIFSCLDYYNKCLSITLPDGKVIQNELCFDNSKAPFISLPPPEDILQTMPLAYQDLQRFSLNEDEEELLNLWYQIMEEARITDNYNSHWNYGVYQITKELDTFHEEGTGRTKKKIYDYPTLHGNLDALRTLLKAYYKKYITPKMFEYELLK